MGKRPSSPRPGLRPMRSAYRQRAAAPKRRRGRPAADRRRWLGWVAAAVVIGAIAFVIGRAGLDAGVPFGNPSGSPSPPLAIRFGLGLDPVTGAVANPTTRFRIGDRVAWSVRLTRAVGTDAILVEVIRLDGTARTTVQPPTSRAVHPEATLIAFRDRASQLLAEWGPGNFEMRIYAAPGAPPIAIGRFTLVETPVPS
jgi:hypothetical protein